MTASNVLTQAIQMLSSGNRDGLLLKPGSGSNGSFGQIMNDSLKNQMDKGLNSSQAVKQNTSCKKQFVSKTETPSVNQKETPMGKDEINSELAGRIEEEIKGFVKEELGLTEEELEAIMSALGLEYLELLLPENMQALVLEVNQADAMELLTNEGLNDQLNTLLLGTKDILSENGLQGSAEELSELLEELKGSLDSLTAGEGGAAEEAGPVIEIVEEKSAETEKDAENPAGEMEAAETLKEGVRSEQTEKNSQNKNAEEGFHGNRESGKEPASFFDQEAGTNPMDMLLQNLSNHMPVEDASMAAAQRLELMRDIVNQVLEQLRITVKPDTTSMELTLNPEHLGKVSLTVISKDGHLTASFVAQNEVTKEAIESQIQTLKESLNSQGIKVEAIEVNIESFAFDERNQMNGGQRNDGQSKPKEKKLTAEDIRKVFGEDTREEEERIDTASITQSGSRVDYTA